MLRLDEEIYGHATKMHTLEYAGQFQLCPFNQATRRPKEAGRTGNGSPTQLHATNRQMEITLTKGIFAVSPSAIPYTWPAAFAVSQAENACAFRVCMKTVPGPACSHQRVDFELNCGNVPVNLQTRPSPEETFEMMPPEATRSRTYLQFHATRWPLSM